MQIRFADCFVKWFPYANLDGGTYLYKSKVKLGGMLAGSTVDVLNHLFTLCFLVHKDLNIEILIFEGRAYRSSIWVVECPYLEQKSSSKGFPCGYKFNRFPQTPKKQGITSISVAIFYMARFLLYYISKSFSYI